MMSFHFDPEHHFKGFLVRSEHFNMDKQGVIEQIYVGIYSKSGGTIGEFSITWQTDSISLEAFNGSWIALDSMPEFLELLRKLNGQDFTPEHFEHRLIDLKFTKVQASIALAQ